MNNSLLPKYILGSLLMSVLVFSNVYAATHLRAITRVQMPLIPADTNWTRFIQNTGSGLSTAFSPRLFGSNYVLENPIFEGRPASKHQGNTTGFSVDRHGNPFQLDDSIGEWFCIGSVTEFEDFNNLPPAGTIAESILWNYVFNRGKDNAIFTQGVAQIASEGSLAAFNCFHTVTGGTGYNSQQGPNSTSCKIYLALDGTALIDVKFKEPIYIKD